MWLLQLEDPSMLPFLQLPKKPKMSFCQAKALQIKTLLAALRKGVRGMHDVPSGQMVHLALPALILSRLKRWQKEKKHTFELEI